ncbi:MULTISPECIES: hypothetical protein [Paenibacillus]|uniref:Virulence-related protein n=1 Tax=Paenibacillus odorifer TaxID=189426 RepID=A0ABX3HGL8_9BACL|nr:hypothetical protein [Paenibacillus odorifer]OMD48541.1 hypothetical protein BSK51_21660 [Paenibacillus odorifer]
MNRKSRKELVKVLSNHFGVQPRYMGAPSFTYAFETSNGIYVVDQNGKVIDSEANLVDLESLLNGLSVSGVAAFADPEDPSNPVAPAEPEASNDHAPSVEAEAPPEPAVPSEQSESSITDLEITVELEGHTGLTLRNLVNLIYSRQALIARALGYNGNIIEEPFITAIHDRTVDTSEKLMEKIAEVANLCPGIGFDFENRKLTFKFFHGELNAEKVQAYTQFVDLLNQTAKTLKYASFKSKDNDNDKFTFRLFLIRLGMVGEEYKTARKVLLDKLEGNSAFRSGSKPEKRVAEIVEASVESADSAEAAEGVS